MTLATTLLTTRDFITRRLPLVAITALCLALLPASASAQLDGHGPDAWRVHGVASNDRLNARMGPGTDYAVIERFAHNARGLQMVTCVPFYTMAHFSAMTDAEVASLPPRWCLMRSADLSVAGWVSARYLVEDSAPSTPSQEAEIDPVSYAIDLVYALYEAADLAQVGGPNPLDPSQAAHYFHSGVVENIRRNPPQVDPLIGAQDFSGHIGAPFPDPQQPMLRGMITINVIITNFGRAHTAVFRLRADPGQPGAPIRIFRIEHDGWAFE
ncbi:hypothetical protein [Pararhodobacter oceanensis]|uniref:hypothetical protein n=1 Tax=Pararhodobacter oceanensis TaxID=2172121 RepID=UPI0010578301|nr:hypothetical protein [Pararhodobacter oceanensis]